jgi:hypothetical protein
MGWCLSGCAILLSDLFMGACMLLDSAHCNLSTLEKMTNVALRPGLVMLELLL